MRPCSALHTSLVSPVCSLPFFSLYLHHLPPNSTTTPTSFIATVSWGITSPSGMSNKGKVCASVCLHHAPERYSSTAECWSPYIWCFYGLVPCISLFLFFIVPSLLQYTFNLRYERREASETWITHSNTRTHPHIQYTWTQTCTHPKKDEHTCAYAPAKILFQCGHSEPTSAPIKAAGAHTHTPIYTPGEKWISGCALQTSPCDPFSTLQLPLSLAVPQFLILSLQQPHPSLQLHRKPLTNQNRGRECALNTPGLVALRN